MQEKKTEGRYDTVPDSGINSARNEDLTGLPRAVYSLNTMLTHLQEVTMAPTKRGRGRPRKDDPHRPQKTSITLDGARWVALKHHAIEQRTTVSRLLADAIDRMLKAR